MSRPSNQMITAAIVRGGAGLELRVSYGSEPTLLDSDVSDDSEALEWRADTLRGVLEANGWTTVAAGWCSVTVDRGISPGARRLERKARQASSLGISER